MLYYIISYRIISYHITEFLKDNPPRALALLALPPPLSLRALRCGTDKISIALYYMIVIYIYIYILHLTVPGGAQVIVRVSVCAHNSARTRHTLANVY